MAEEKEKISIDLSKVEAFVATYAPVNSYDECAVANAEEFSDDRLRNFFGCWRDPGMPDALPAYIEELTAQDYTRGVTWDGVPAFFVTPTRKPRRIEAPLFTPEEQDAAQREILGIGADTGSPTLLPGENHDVVREYPNDITTVDAN